MTSAHIQIVGWNHRDYLASCVRSCLGQTVSMPVLYVDNASADGSADFVRQAFPSVRVLANTTNRGYAGGHNDGLRLVAGTDIAILLNPDVVLAPAFVEEILKGFSDARVGAVAPLLLRKLETGNWKLENAGQRASIIDAYGTRLMPSLRAVNQFEGLALSRSPWNNPVSSLQSPVSSVWGFTGAAVALRRAALADVAEDGQVFDEDLFSYREDVDLSWRLKHRGWKIIGAPAARATHVRQVRRGAGKSHHAARLSWRNFFLVLVKDVPGSVLRRQVLPVAAECFLRILRLLLTPFLWPAFTTFVRLFPRAVRKRHRIFTFRTQSS